MRKLLFLALLPALFAGCVKDDDDVAQPIMPPYIVTGLSDVTLQKISSGPAAVYNSYVQVEYQNGEQERVTISLENLPTGLVDSLETPSGYPTFYTGLHLVDSGVAAGSYNARLVVSGDRSGRREYPFAIRVLAAPNCAPSAVGNYTGNSSCGAGSNYSVSVQSPAEHRITVSNFNNSGVQLYANTQCMTGSDYVYLTFPSQTVGGNTYSGSGNYYVNSSSGQHFINISIRQNNQNNCNYYYSR